MTSSIVYTDIQVLVNSCTWPRDRALNMLMWDSGARISEITSLNIGHVQFDRYGAVIIVTGKTGRRRLGLIRFSPGPPAMDESPSRKIQR